MPKKVEKFISSPRDALIWSVLLSLAIWFLPGFSWVMAPLLYLNTHIHELCHAIATLATGGNVGRIEVYAGGSGVTLTQGGIRIIISSAGYVGASLVGSYLVASSANRKSARTALLAVAVTLGIGLGIWLRGDLVGVISAVAWIVALSLVLRNLSAAWITFSCQFLGIQQCLMSVQALLVLWKVTSIPGLQNDALNASEIIPFPPVMWAIAWLLFSLVAMGASLRRVWSVRASSPGE